MIFSPHRYRQQNHRQSCSCSLFLLDNILTKSALTTPRVLTTPCSTGSQPPQKLSSPRHPESSSQLIYKEGKRGSESMLEVFLRPRNKDTPQPFFCCETKKKRSEADLDRFTTTRQFALTEIETNRGSSKGLEKFLNPFRGCDPASSDTENTQPASERYIKSRATIAICGTSSSRVMASEKYATQGTERFVQGDYAGAVYLLTRAIDTNSGSSDKVLACRALSYCYTGSLDLALSDILRAIAVSPRNAQLHADRLVPVL